MNNKGLVGNTSDFEHALHAKGKCFRDCRLCREEIEKDLANETQARIVFDRLWSDFLRIVNKKGV